MPKELVGFNFYQGKNPIRSLELSLEYKFGMSAHYWRILPSELRSKSPEEQGELLALYDAHNAIEGYYSSERMRQMDRDNPPKSN